MTSYDAAIIGGGLAGCSAAITLAQLGAHVILLEAKTYPHHKVCGEFLSPECHYFFDQLGLTSTLEALKPTRINTVFISSIAATWEAKLPGSAWGLSRYAFDAALVGQARTLGVNVREATTVTVLSGSLNSGFELNVRGIKSIQARSVIAAHGKRSTVDRLLDRKFLRNPQPFIALKAHFRNLPLPDRIELHTFPGGYCGMSEIEGGLVNMCLLVHERIFHRAGSIPKFLEWMQSQNAHLQRRFSQAERVSQHWLSIAQIPFVPKSLFEGDVLMAGDAAGLIAPLAGDGMAMALHSGLIAGEKLSHFLSGQISAEHLKRAYAAEWRANFGARLHVGRVIQPLMLRPHLFAHALRLLNAVPSLGNFFVCKTRDMRFIRQGDLT